SGAYRRVSRVSSGVVQPVEPVIRSPALVRDGNHMDVLIPFDVVDAEREAAQEPSASRAALVRREGGWRGPDLVDCLLNRRPKILAETGLPPLVEVGRNFQLGLRLRVQDDGFHRLYFSRSRAITSSAGVPFTFPLSSSAIRRFRTASKFGSSSLITPGGVGTLA